MSQERSLWRTNAVGPFSLKDTVCAAVQLSWGRPVWTWQTFVAFLLLGLAAGVVVAYRWLRGKIPGDEFASEFLMGGYVGFLLPVFCLAFGSQLVSGVWEEGWLVWLLLRPIPRPVVYALLLAVALPWTLALTLGGVVLLALLAGPGSLTVTIQALLPLTAGAVAYLTFFVLLSVLFRRSTLVGVAYVFVIENVIGYMPGLMSRGSISFYIRSLIAAQGVDFDHSDAIFSFVPVDPTVAWWALISMTLAFVLAGGIMFSRREYGDPAI